MRNWRPAASNGRAGDSAYAKTSSAIRLKSPAARVECSEREMLQGSVEGESGCGEQTTGGGEEDTCRAGRVVGSYDSDS